MPHKIIYKTYIGPVNEKFGLREQDSPDPFLIIDNQDSTRESNTFTASEDSPKKQIFRSKSFKNSQTVESNTSDVEATDIFDKDGSPLFYKTPIDGSYTTSVSIDNKELLFDNHFIYHNKEEVGRLALVKRKSGNPHTVRLQRSKIYPDHADPYYAKHIGIDSKFRSVSKKNSKIVVKFSNPNLHIGLDGVQLFDCSIEEDSAKISPFLYRDQKVIDGIKSSFEYDYADTLFNVKDVRSENVTDIRDEIRLSNSKIIPGTLSGECYVSGRSEPMIVSESKLLGLDSFYGVVFIDQLSSDYDIERIVFSYKCVEEDSNVVNLSTPINLKDKNVELTVRPTMISRAGITTVSEPKVDYTITNSSGEILYSIDRDISRLNREIPVFVGFGEGEYSENGYSGITDKRTNEVVGGIGYTGTGFSDSFYSDGPFGGTYISNIEDVKRLLAARSNSQEGLYAIGTIKYRSGYSKLAGYRIKKPSTSASKNIPYEIQDTSRVLMYYGKEVGKYFNSSTVPVFNAEKTIPLDYEIIREDELGLIVRMDISSLRSKLTTLDPADPIVKYMSISINTHSFNPSDIIISNGANITEMVLSQDEDTLFVKAEKSAKGARFLYNDTFLGLPI